MRSDLVDLMLIKVYETDKAVLFKESDGDEDGVWLPKSIIEVHHKKGNIYEVTLPEYLAHEKGLI
jgi:hypothetical protein